MDEIQGLIDQLRLEPLSREGGLFASTYRSNQLIDGKPVGTAIYFMLTGGGYSHLHKLPTDEVYHFYKGDPVELLELYPDGTAKVVVLGGDILAGQQVQYVVKAGVWQGSRLQSGGTFALMGTTMAPGFVEADYVHADPETLKKQYPQVADRICDLTGEPKFC